MNKSDQLREALQDTVILSHNEFSYLKNQERCSKFNVDMYNTAYNNGIKAALTINENYRDAQKAELNRVRDEHNKQVDKLYRQIAELKAYGKLTTKAWWKLWKR